MHDPRSTSASFNLEPQTRSLPPHEAFIASGVILASMLAVYFGTGWLVAMRGTFSTFYFDLERHIPFLLPMILPYATWEPMMVLSPLACADTGQIKLLTRRMLFAILLSRVIFVVWPLQFGLPRPRPEGVLGFIVRFYWVVDYSHNLFPSLHVSVAVILWPVYARIVPRGWRGAMHLWFVLVILSTVLVYQHHVIDVLGGLAVGLLAFRLFRPPLQGRTTC